MTCLQFCDFCHIRLHTASQWIIQFACLVGNIAKRLLSEYHLLLQGTTEAMEWLHFIETPIFEKLIGTLLSMDEYQKLQAHLVADPTAGVTLSHTGGCRKIRWALPAKGKSGGVRVIYYFLTSTGEIYLLYAYPKSSQDNLTDKQKAVMKQLAQSIEAGK